MQRSREVREPTPDLYIEHLVTVFRELWRVLRGIGQVGDVPVDRRIQAESLEDVNDMPAKDVVGRETILGFDA